MPDIFSATKLLEKPAVNEERLLASSWQVIVHNDPVNLMSYVTMVFQKVFGFKKAIAEKHMMEVHTQGRSIVWVGLREEAEFYVEQLHGFLILATLEQV
ncbi:MAG: ATP-dependent Clp protease adapter ClpS [Verrucomicrobia bacterium]|nr:ATP-dependent Clp protease adapter ClpS [Verrucomicrobiota bacterium]